MASILEAADNLLIEKMKLGQPWQRGAFGFGVTSAFIYAMKPEFAYNPDGTAKEWSVIAPVGSEPQNTTNIPWYLPGLFVGSMLSLFV